MESRIFCRGFLTAISSGMGSLMIMLLAMFLTFFFLMRFEKQTSPDHMKNQQKRVRTSSKKSLSKKSVFRKFLELEAKRSKLIGQYSEQMANSFFSVYPMIFLAALPAALATVLAAVLLHSKSGLV